MSTRESIVSIVGKVPHDDKARTEKWASFARRTASVAQVLGNSGEVEDARCLASSVEGGNCPRCETPWEEVTVDNPFVLGVRYRPACECLPRWTEKERRFKDGSVIYDTQEKKEELWADRCDACRTVVMMNKLRGHRGYRGHHAKYERVLCASCSKGKE